MHRANLLALLARYSSRFVEEQQMIKRLEKFVSEEPDCFQRTLKIGHITGSAWVVDAAHEKTLLTHHKKLNRWLQPGGHADGDADIAEVAMREAREESGLAGLILVSDELFDVDIHLIPARVDEPEHFHYDCRFLISAGEDESYAVSDESHDLAWIALTDIESYTDESSILRMVAKTVGAEKF